VDCIAAEIAKLTDIVKGMELIMTTGTDGIECDDRERGRKDEERRPRGGRVLQGKQMEKNT